MTHGAGVIVEVVCTRDFDATRTESLIDKIVSNDWDLPITKGQVNHLADQVFVTLVFGVYAQRTVGQHGLGARGGDGHAGQRLNRAVCVSDGLWAIGKRVMNMPQVPLGFDGLHLKVRDRRHELGIPVDQALAAIDEALLV